MRKHILKLTLILLFLIFNFSNAQERQRHQTSSPTFVDNKMYVSNNSINELQILLNEKKTEDWNTNIPIAMQYYDNRKYIDCINLCNKVLNRTGWSNPTVYFILGDSYKEIKYYKSAKKYLSKAKKKGNYKASYTLEELKKNYKKNKSEWLKK